jgi:hypothetical protein
VIAVPDDGRRWWTLVGCDADTVARRLERHRAVPVDFDAFGTVNGVTFDVLAAR